MSRRHNHDKNTSAPNTQPPYPSRGGIHRPSQGLQHLQPFTTHRYTGKVWLSPKTILINQTHVQKILVKLIIDKIEISIDFKVGFKQCDSMPPVLFMFLMVAFDKKIEDKWTSLGLSKSQFSRKDNSPIPTRQLVSNQTGTFTCGTLFDLLYTLYLDSGEFSFETRTGIERVINILYKHFTWFGIGINIGTGTNLSKNECKFFPPTGFFNTHNSQINDPTNYTLFFKNK